MAEFERSSEESAPKPEEAEGLAPQPQEAETAVKLSQPSRELASRLLSKVSYNERIIGVRSHPHPGAHETSIYSFAEAANFLDGGDLTGKDLVHTIRFDTLKKWIGETLGDKELAQAIGEVTKELSGKWTMPYRRYLRSLALIRPVKELMLKRLKQCMEILREETEA